MASAPTCTRCWQSHSSPQAFLLSCGACAKSWHHRCHQPPVSDHELVARIKAFNQNDIDNSIFGWICRKCSKRHHPPRAHPQPDPIPPRDVPSKTNLAPTWFHNRHPLIRHPSPPILQRKPLARRLDSVQTSWDPLNFTAASWPNAR